MNKKVKISDLYDVGCEYLKDLFLKNEYPWEILPKISSFINERLSSGILGFGFLKTGVLVGSGVKIYENVVIEPPCIIGSGTVIRPGAFLRGNVICGENCVLGNSSEFKNCVLLDNVDVPHYNYVGDSVLGNHAHMGAGSICSNLKADKKNVVINADKKYETGLRKVGAFLADNADIGSGCVLNPGTVVGKNTSVYPLTALRGVYGENLIVKSNDNIVKRV